MTVVVNISSSNVYKPVKLVFVWACGLTLAHIRWEYMLRQVRSHGLDIDAHQRVKLQLWLVHKRFGWAYLCACVRSRRDWLWTKQYQRVHEFLFISNRCTTFGSCSQVTNQLVYQPLPMLISSTQVQLHCRLDFFTYRNLFQNEISDDFSSKSLLKLLIYSNAHIHNYRSRKKRWNLELEIGFRL